MQEEGGAACVSKDRGECFWGNASAVPSEFMGKFHRSSEGDNHIKKQKEERVVCTTNNVMLWPETSLLNRSHRVVWCE